MLPALIHKTTNYNKFNKLQGNRKVSPKKVLRIVKDVKDGVNLFPYCPIIVDSNYDIIDGQHRFSACKEMQLPVYYVVAKKLSLQDIAKLNSATDKWKNSDFIECYIELGNEDYALLRNFMKEYKLSLSVAVSLLKYDIVAGGGSVLAEFKDGKFECRHYQTASNFIEKHDDLFGSFTFYRDRNLMQATHQVFKQPGFDHERMKAQIKLNLRMIEKQSTSRIYKLMMDKVYNFGLTQPLKLI